MKKTIGKFLMLTALAGTVSSGFASSLKLKEGEGPINHPADIALQSKESIRAFGIVSNVFDCAALAFVEKDPKTGNTTTVGNHIVDLISKNAVKEGLSLVENDLATTSGALYNKYFEIDPKDENDVNQKAFMEGFIEVMNDSMDNPSDLSGMDIVKEQVKKQVIGVDANGYIADQDSSELFDNYVNFLANLKAKELLLSANSKITVEKAFENQNAIAKTLHDMTWAKKDKFLPENVANLEQRREANRQKAVRLEEENAQLKSQINQLEAQKSQQTGPVRIRPGNNSAIKTVQSTSTTQSGSNPFANRGKKVEEQPREESIVTQSIQINKEKKLTQPTGTENPFASRAKKVEEQPRKESLVKQPIQINEEKKLVQNNSVSNPFVNRKRG